MLYRGLDGCLRVGVEPLQAEAVEVGDQGRSFPVGIYVGPDLASLDALPDQADD